MGVEDLRLEKYTRVFGCPIDADAGENCLAFPASYLDYVLRQNEDSLHSFLETAPWELMRFGIEGLVAAIKRMIGTDFHRKKCLLSMR